MSEENKYSYDENGEEEVNEEIDSKEVKKGSTGKIFIFLALGVLVIFIAVISLSRCALVREDKVTETNQTLETENNEANTGSGNVINEAEKASETTSQDSIKSEKEEEDISNEQVEDFVQENNNSNIESSQNSSNEESNSMNTGLVKVQEPSTLGEVLTSDVLVSGKEVYQIGDSFAYSLKLVVATGNQSNDGYSIVKYFCPKGTYDAVNSGETLIAKFQLSSDGTIAFTSISKKDN